MRLYPAIDIKNGKCVRLRQGSFADVTVYEENPVKVARAWKEAGAEYIHIVDLDGALEGRFVNADIIREIAGSVNIPVQTGGGIRSLENIRERLDAGVSRVIIGTKAVKEPEFVAEAVKIFGSECIVAGLDGKAGMAAVEGWEKYSEKTVIDLAFTMKNAGVNNIVYTDISRDGMLTGPDFGYTGRLVSETGLNIIASGGVSGMEDLERLSKMGVEGVIIGKALYEGKIDLKQAIMLYNNK